MKEQFKIASTRDKLAVEYFTSEEFLNLMRENVKRDLVNHGRTRASIHPKVAFKPQDMPYVQEAFAKVKEEFPELNHVRFTADCIVADTKKNTFRRRFSHGCWPY